MLNVLKKENEKKIKKEKLWKSTHCSSRIQPYLPS